MTRKQNTTTTGHGFTQDTIVAVWRKARIVPGVDPAVRRKDACNAWIEFANYGKTVHDGTGWEIDHVMPVSRGGTDSLSNLQPLQWENNRHKGDNYPNWSCATSAAQ